MRALILASGFAAAMVSVNPVTAAHLTAGELAALVPGKFDAVYDGSEISIEAHANGALNGSSFLASDQGRWHIKGDLLCISLEETLEGGTRCSPVAKSGNWYVANGVRFKPSE